MFQHVVFHGDTIKKKTESHELLLHIRQNPNIPKLVVTLNGRVENMKLDQDKLKVQDLNIQHVLISHSYHIRVMILAMIYTQMQRLNHI